MKLVIDIDEEDYAVILASADIVNKRKKHTLEEAVLNGIPLPKGHGRLKDVDALYDRAKLCHTEEDGTACVEWREINDAPTIIEADKEN